MAIFEEKKGFELLNPGCPTVLAKGLIDTYERNDLLLFLSYFIFE